MDNINNNSGIDTKHIHIDKNYIHNSVNIDIGCTIEGINNISKDVNILHNSVIKNMSIGANTKVDFSYMEDSIVGDNCIVGPFARIRPNCIMGNNIKLGNFVEIKNSVIGDGTKISHLAYVGDSVVGKNCNIGCGVIFANYNGKEKNKIVIGDNCFIGSNCNLIAPLKISDNTYICAGTTVTKDTNPYDFVIGRSRETIKPNRASKYMKE